MKHSSVITGILLAIASATLFQGSALGESSRSNPPPPTTGRDKKILAVLDEMVKSHQTYLSVPPEDGKALRLLTEAIASKRVVEIGTSTGYSGLWFCLALQRTEGHLITFEIDHQRASIARQYFKEAGVENLVTIVEGDAHEEVTKLQGAIDVVFIDADKGGYVDYLNKLLPIVRPGGLILAHNVNMVPDLRDSGARFK
jgi:predicted O-methyltransferase YrrM